MWSWFIIVFLTYHSGLGKTRIDCFLSVGHKSKHTEKDLLPRQKVLISSYRSQFYLVKITDLIRLLTSVAFIVSCWVFQKMVSVEFILLQRVYGIHLIRFEKKIKMKHQDRAFQLFFLYKHVRKSDTLFTLCVWYVSVGVKCKHRNMTAITPCI